MSAGKRGGLKRADRDFYPAYQFALFLGLAIVIALADRAPIDLESVTPDVLISQRFLYYWQGVVFRFFPGPYVYRIVIPYLLWALNRITFLDLITLDFFVKILLLLGAQLMFYKYLSAVFQKLESLLGVLIFDAVLGYLLSFIKGPSVIETIDILNVLLITAGLWAIYANNISLLCFVLVLGLLNRETPLILSPILAIYDWTNKKRLRRAVFVSFLALLVFLAPRFLIPTWADANWFNANELHSNLPFFSDSPVREALIGNFRLAILIGPLALIGLHKFRDQPQFLKIVALMLPFLIAVHYFVGRIIEARLWMPLFPLLIPLAINNLAKVTNRKP